MEKKVGETYDRGRGRNKEKEQTVDGVPSRPLGHECLFALENSSHDVVSAATRLYPHLLELARFKLRGLCGHRVGGRAFNDIEQDGAWCSRDVCSDKLLHEDDSE